MRFVCIQCGRKDIVIGDKAPLCLVCGSPLVKATEKYTGVLMSPNVAISRFKSAVEKYGYERALTGYVKQEREAWIAAAWALCMRQETGRQYWIEIETQDLTPDCKVIYIDQSKGHNQRCIHNLEIVEWDHHRENVMDLIRQKCANGYPSYFTLVVLARNGKGLQLPADLKGLDELNIPFSEMWVMGRASPFTTKYSVCLFHPYTKLMEFDLLDALEKNKGQTGFLIPQGRGRGTEFTDLGPLYLPLKDG